jgi:hypothetical protein
MMSGKITQISDKLIWYEYKGDEIAWTGDHYLSIGCLDEFPTLEAMDEFWEEYYTALRS